MGTLSVDAERGVDEESVRDGVNRLQRRAFGGEDVAVRPSAEDHTWWPRAPLVPGVQEAIDRFIANSAADTALEVVFLVGGAGNGKSFAARYLGDQLGLKSHPSDSLAHRIYSGSIKGAEFHLLNDATIAPSKDYENQDAALAEDLAKWWSSSKDTPVRSFCCVNRGIISDEIRALQQMPGSAHLLSLSILRWLASPEEGHFEALGAEGLCSPGADGSHAAHNIEFNLDGRQIRLIALAVDSHSLFATDGSETSRAQALFSGLISRFGAVRDQRPELCPIRANIQQWQTGEGIQAWQELLSSAEIASGRMYSYRDVWGAAALSVLGPRVDYGSVHGELLDHVDELLGVAARNAELSTRLAALVRLSRLRAHSALFRAPSPIVGALGTEYPPATPIHAGLALVDPAVWRSTDSRSVEAAMQRVAMGDLPSGDALGLLSGSLAWSQFDAYLEETLLEFLESPGCGDIERRRLVSWYGAYVARLVGIGTSTYGNAEIIKQWRRCKRSCANKPVALPSDLERSIRSLIFPQHPDGPANSMLMPAFSVRAEPISSLKDQVHPRLVEVVPISAVSLRVRTMGGRLLIECYTSENAGVIGQLALDFALLREAQSFSEDRSGQTESTAYIEPRIERCRSSSIAAIDHAQQTLAVVANGRHEELAI